MPFRGIIAGPVIRGLAAAAMALALTMAPAIAKDGGGGGDSGGNSGSSGGSGNSGGGNSGSDRGRDRGARSQSEVFRDASGRGEVVGMRCSNGVCDVRIIDRNGRLIRERHDAN